jgi:Xaa-Pro aminopeptidase
MTSARYERLLALLAQTELDALIIAGASDLLYITGFTDSDAVALVSASGDSLFLTDFRYQEQAREEVDPAFEQEIVDGNLHEALARTLVGRVGFDDAATTVAERSRLEQHAGAGVELVAARGLVGRLRAVKDAAEIELIAAAAALVDGIYDWLLERGLGGRAEREVAIELEHEMRLRGASAPSFDSVVASGAHGALPHAKPRAVAIEPGTLVTVDIGARVGGYCSDCTRTFAVGEPSAQALEVYGVVLAAQLAGLDAVAPGRNGVEVDARARAVIDDAGYGENYGHGLGHGVGLDIHEPPRLSPHASPEPLLAGNVVTVEPGIYLPGELGVLIEDLVVLSGDGARRLSQLTKELLVVD